MTRSVVLWVIALTILTSTTSRAQTGVPPDADRIDIGPYSILVWPGNGTFFTRVDTFDVGERGLVWFIVAWNASDPPPRWAIRVEEAPDEVQFLSMDWTAQGVGPSDPICKAPRRCMSGGFSGTASDEVVATLRFSIHLSWDMTNGTHEGWANHTTSIRFVGRDLGDADSNRPLDIEHPEGMGVEEQDLPMPGLAWITTSIIAPALMWGKRRHLSRGRR